MFKQAIKKAIGNVEDIENLCFIGNRRNTKYLNIEEFQKLPYRIYEIVLDDISFQELESEVNQFGKNTVLFMALPFWVKESSRTEIFNWLMRLEMKRMNIVNISVGIENVNIEEKTEKLLFTLFNKIIAADNEKMKINNSYYFKRLKSKGSYVIEDSNGSYISFEVDKVIMENDFLDINNKVIQIPAGEVFVVPKKNSVHGTLRLQKKDGICYININNDFANLSYIEKGLYLPVCEVGFGTNPAIPNISNLPYIEKKYGTYHLGFGNNMNFGGEYIYPIHFDLVSNSKEFNLRNI